MMLSIIEYKAACKKTIIFLEEAGFILNKDEKNRIQVVEYGLDNLELIGLQLVEYINTERCCAKELVLFRRQTCPEHRHPEINGKLGKEETFRCRKGIVYLYVEGIPTLNIHAKLPIGKEHTFTVFHEIVLKPGDQYTIMPNTRHWFQAGEDGAIISEFSTKSIDEKDIYTDKEIIADCNRIVEENI